MISFMCEIKKRKLTETDKKVGEVRQCGSVDVSFQVGGEPALGEPWTAQRGR